MEGGEEIDAPNPSSVAWLPFNTTGPIITPSPLAAHTHSSSSRELANTLHPLMHTHIHNSTHTHTYKYSVVGSVFNWCNRTVWFLWHSSKSERKMIWLAGSGVRRLSGSPTILLRVSPLSVCASFSHRLCVAHLINAVTQLRECVRRETDECHIAGVARCLMKLLVSWYWTCLRTSDYCESIGSCFKLKIIPLLFLLYYYISPVLPKDFETLYSIGKMSKLGLLSTNFERGPERNLSTACSNILSVINLWMSVLELLKVWIAEL